MRVGKSQNVIFVDFRPDDATTEWIIATSESERAWAETLEERMDAAFKARLSRESCDTDLDGLLFGQARPQLVK